MERPNSDEKCRLAIPNDPCRKSWASSQASESVFSTPQPTMLTSLADCQRVSNCFRNSKLEWIASKFFSRQRSELEHVFPLLRKDLAQTGMLWISWPKPASKIPTDVNENVVREI